MNQSIRIIDSAMAAAALICIAGCDDSQSASTSDTSSNAQQALQGQEATVPVTNAASTPALKDTIAETRAAFAARADDDTKRIYAEGIDAVAESGVLDQAKNVGDTAPAFTLPDATGRDISLARLLADGPVVAIWYRGGWCPYCNLTLRAYQEILPQIKDAGATLVAISPELPDNALSTQEKNELDFVVLTDDRNRVARDYGVVFGLTDAVHDNYNENFKIDTWNGEDSGELPLAATYVIDRHGTITWAFLDADYRERAEPGDVLAALRDLASTK